MFWKSVSKLVRIQLFSGYNTELCNLTIILKKFVVASDECSLCKEDSETIQHVFFFVIESSYCGIS